LAFRLRPWNVGAVRSTCRTIRLRPSA